MLGFIMQKYVHNVWTTAATHNWDVLLGKEKNRRVVSSSRREKHPPRAR
jgi:hypothetical protein